jgi:hypothetical protein
VIAVSLAAAPSMAAETKKKTGSRNDYTAEQRERSIVRRLKLAVKRMERDSPASMLTIEGSATSATSTTESKHVLVCARTPAGIHWRVARARGFPRISVNLVWLRPLVVAGIGVGRNHWQG